jgi:predicted ATP-dependent serine protease
LEASEDPLADPRGEDEAIQDAIEAAVDDLYIRDEARRIHSADKVVEFRQIDLEGLLALPEPDPMIEGILDWGTVTLLSGPSGKGKSFIALDWALSVATECAWMEHSVVPGHVLYVAAEGGHGQSKRVKAWLNLHKFDLSQPTIKMVIDPINLSNSGQVDRLVQIVHDEEYDLVVIDTLAKCTAGVDENSASEMGLVIAALYKIRDAIEENGTSVLVVHHTGYDTKRARGSSAIVAGVDSVYDLNADDPRDMIRIQCSKRKDGEPPHQMLVRLKEVGTSCIVTDDLDMDGDGVPIKPIPRTVSEDTEMEHKLRYEHGFDGVERTVRKHNG